MAIKSNNTTGNPYHDERTGQFTGENGGGAKQSGSISFVPNKTSLGTDRKFYSDFSNEEKQKLFDLYNENHGQESEIIVRLKFEYDTSKNNSEKRELEREGWIVDEFNEQSKTPKRKEKKATILLGLPGSGKSTIANPLMEQDGAFIIDADNFKNRIPEFQKDKMMVSAVHEESVNLSNRFREELSKQGYNMVIGKVGGDYESVGYIADQLAEQGYEIKVVLNDLPLEFAIDRTIGRYERKETKRLVLLSTLISADKNIFKTFDKLLNHKAVVGGKIYSNDVPRDTQPVLLKEFKKGEQYERL